MWGSGRTWTGSRSIWPGREAKAFWLRFWQQHDRFLVPSRAVRGAKEVGSGHRLTGSGLSGAGRGAEDMGIWPQADRFPLLSGEPNEVGFWLQSDRFLAPSGKVRGATQVRLWSRLTGSESRHR